LINAMMAAKAGEEAEVPPAPPKLKAPVDAHEGGWPEGTASA
jgi:hypothetical protein